MSDAVPTALDWAADILDRRCRRCGCHEYDACVDADGRPCSWAAPDLCSACADAEGRR